VAGWSAPTPALGHATLDDRPLEEAASDYGSDWAAEGQTIDELLAAFDEMTVWSEALVDELDLDTPVPVPRDAVAGDSCAPVSVPLRYMGAEQPDSSRAAVPAINPVIIVFIRVIPSVATRA